MMKQGSFKIICLIVWACIAVLSSYGDESTNDFVTHVMESFNGDSDYTWKAESSKFATKIGDVTYPELIYVDAWPIAAFGNNRGDNNQELKSLGLHGKFDRRGYNWIDLYPVKSGDDNPEEIQIPGRVRNIDMWIWGSNLNFYIEIYLRDYQGVVHSLRMGDLAYSGWKNIRVNVPTSIPQSKKILPSYAGLKFVKFRIWTQPSERVSDFYIYFKQFKVLTDMFEGLYDGNDLADPQNVERIWANNRN
jgi:hypothetical protein